MMEADPVITAATVFAMATRRFAVKAKITVISDEDDILTLLVWPMEPTVPNNCCDRFNSIVRRSSAD